MEKQATLKIYKASAGSGKTFRLVAEYLKLIIENQTAYLNILAVTFTNKATAEMKSRILTELSGLANGLEDSESYLNIILQDFEAEDIHFSVSDIRQRAQSALSLLLHDYSRFRIETIDSFFQSVLRNLSKELGLGAYMNIELDANPVLSEAVKMIFSKAKEDPQLLEWISDYIDNRIEEGGSWRLNLELEEFGGNIFKENFKSKEKELQVVLQDKKFLKNFRRHLIELRDKKTEEVCEKAMLFRMEMEKNDLLIDDFYYGASGVAGYFNKIIDKKDMESGMSGRALKCSDDPTAWPKKTSPRAAQITALAENVLQRILNETETMRTKNLEIINTCNLILKHINNIGLLYDIAEAVRELNGENNRFMLADTPNLLHELIKEEDAPFIYEKIGASLQHIMIDEFQDTSRVQWQNFKPLLMEGLAQNADSLIVGDQKQAIYRWRNSDWRILGNLKNEFLPMKTEEIALNTNRRSEERIVSFNNHVFSAAVKFFPDNELFPAEEMKNAYSDIVQQCSKKGKAGFVKAEFISETNNQAYKERMSEKLVANIEMLQEQGVKPQQITILVRKNKMIPLIAEYLAAYGKEHPEKPYRYDVVSDQAYRLDASLAIHLIIAALQYISDPQNEIFATELFVLYQTEIADSDTSGSAGELYSKKSEETARLKAELKKASFLPLYELIEEIYRLLNLQKINDQESYLYSFLDGVNEFLNKKSSDVRLFLEYWDKTLKHKTIPFSSEIEGIRIISIHKSKGLEFHSVIIPFCDWPLTHEQGMNPLLWSSSGQPPFDLLPLFPVKYGKKMIHSFLSLDFYDETVQLWVDNLNLLYVALTRAEKNMIIIGKDKKEEEGEPEKNDSAPPNISELLENVLESSENEILNADWDSETRTYLSGEIFIGEKTTREKSENRLKKMPSVLNFPYHSYRQKAKFQQSDKSKEFIAEKEDSKSNDYINRGKLLHYLFSNIKTQKDIPSAVEQLYYEGLIHDRTEKKSLEEYVLNAVSIPEVQKWFDPDTKIINEKDLIFIDENGDFQNRRPDRIIRLKDETIVVDFKFGKERKEHHSQVKEYIALLKEMGYPNICGYLWYIDQQQLKRVGN